MEKTLVILKPDAVKRKLIGEIISRFEKKNYNILQLKVMNIDKALAEEHYAHIKAEPIFDDMINYIVSGSVVVLIIEGQNAIHTVRNMIGKTSSFDSIPGTIRGDYGSHRFENLIHASDSPESFETEVNRFFPKSQKY
jgi:nucleoside-diphosphate kinase